MPKQLFHMILCKLPCSCFITAVSRSLFQLLNNFFRQKQARFLKCVATDYKQHSKLQGLYETLTLELTHMS